MNVWGQKAQTKKYKDKMQFLNRSKKKFDWDNEELEENVGLVEPEKLIYPDIPAEIPGVVLESDFDEQEGPVQSVPDPTHASLAAAALRNAGLSDTTGVLPKTIGVDFDMHDPAVPDLTKESDSELDSDDDNDDDNDDKPLNRMP